MTTIPEKVYYDIVRKINLCSFETQKGTSVKISVVQDVLEKYFENITQERTYKQWLLEAISYIWQDQWREESEDMYRKHFWLPTLYDKKD